MDCGDLAFFWSPGNIQPPAVNDVGGSYHIAHPVWRRTRAFANPLFLFRVFILSCFRDSPIRLVLSGILNGTR